MDDHKERVCPICNKTVAPYAPERMVLGKEVVHRPCFDNCSAWKQAQLVQAAGAAPDFGLR
jgi:hypothetical protein